MGHKAKTKTKKVKVVWGFGRRKRMVCWRERKEIENIGVNVTRMCYICIKLSKNDH